jgi:hypothetical protein
MEAAVEDAAYEEEEGEGEAALLACRVRTLGCPYRLSE